MSQPTRAAAAVCFVLIVSGTVVSIAGTDLVLPAVPSLPALLGGTPVQAQFVLAGFVAGSGVGLLVFADLGSRFDPRLVLVGSLASYGLVSVAAAFAPSLPALILLRTIQGFAGAAPAVFATGFIRALFPAGGAVRAVGLLGSIQSLVPALAPLAGAWLLGRFGWQSPFVVTGGLSLILALVFAGFARHFPGFAAEGGGGCYAALLRRPKFLRYALSQALTLGGLLTFVFGAPAVITGALKGGLSDFIVLQVTGIAFFILASTLSGSLSERFGSDRLIFAGTALSAAGMVAIFGYAVSGGGDPTIPIFPWIPVNVGLGLRGPPGFLRAIVAAQDDARGAALVVLAILAVTALGTAAVAPTIETGLTGLASVAALISCGAVLCLLLPGASRPEPAAISRPR